MKTQSVKDQLLIDWFKLKHQCEIKKHVLASEALAKKIKRNNTEPASQITARKNYPNLLYNYLNISFLDHFFPLL